jgi:GAF domain-containing protein
MASGRRVHEERGEPPPAGDRASYGEADRVLRSIVEGTSVALGDDFFRVLVRHLASGLRVPYAFVSECVVLPSELPAQAQALAFWMGSDFGEAGEYLLSGTPCEDVLRSGQCRFYPRELQALFPEDRLLGEIGAESYLAVPLVADSGQVIGHLAIMDREPLVDLETKRIVLRIFAARTAAEMERRHAERERDRLLADLQQSLLALRTLRSLIPICAWCKRVRSDRGYWDDLQTYVERTMDASFTHGICPGCADQVMAGPS